MIAIRKNQKVSLAAIPVGLAALVYLAGIVSQFIRNTQVWKAAGGIPGIGNPPTFPSFSLGDALHSCVQDWYGLAGLGICLVLFAVLLFGVLHIDLKGGGKLDRERNFSFSKKGTYGTAAFMDKKEIARALHLEKNLDDTSETILGKVDNRIVTVPADSSMNRNIAVCGSPGSRKSRSFTRNMILQCVRRGESLVITDSKGEIYSDFAGYLKDNGYQVRVFNSDRPNCSDSWDLLGEVQGDPLMAELIADVMVTNTGMGKDPFWDGAEKNLLKAVLLYVDALESSRERNMSSVYRLITVCNQNVMLERFRGLDAEHPAKMPFDIFMAQDKVTRGKIVNGLGTRLQVFQNSTVCGMTSFPEIDLTLPGAAKCAYFCVNSDQHNAFDFLTTLFITFSFIKLVRFADAQPDRQLPVPVHILGEELANLCAIPNLGKRLSTVRSRGISMSCVFQSIPQLQNRYPNDEWLEIIGDCDVQLFLGCTDPVTAKFFSDRSGIASVEVGSQSKQLNSWRVSDYTPQYRRTEGIGKRQIVTPDEVLRMPLDEAIVVLRGENVLKVQKFDYSEHPDAKRLRPSNAAKHRPSWLAASLGTVEVAYDPKEEKQSYQMTPEEAAQLEIISGERGPVKIEERWR